VTSMHSASIPSGPSRKRRSTVKPVPDEALPSGSSEGTQTRSVKKATLGSSQLKPQVSVLLYDLAGLLLTTDEILDAFQAEAPNIIEKVYTRKSDNQVPSVSAASRFTIGEVTREQRKKWTFSGYWHAVGTTPVWIKRLDSSVPASAPVLLEDVRHGRPDGFLFARQIPG
jgi:hypothetical protein